VIDSRDGQTPFGVGIPKSKTVRATVAKQKEETEKFLFTGEDPGLELCNAYPSFDLWLWLDQHQ
jgi:hypothetical protein